MKYELITWTPVITNEFNERLVEEALYSAWTYYIIGKDKSIEKKIRSYLISSSVKLEEMIERIREIVYGTYPVEFKADILESNLEEFEADVEVFSLYDVETMRMRTFTGSLVLNLNTSLKHSNLKSVGQSFTEGIVKSEMRLFASESDLLREIYLDILNQIKNEWDVPLRLGTFNLNKFGSSLLYFWRMKEIRDSILKRLKFDITPSETLFIPKYKTVPGFVELRNIN